MVHLLFIAFRNQYKNNNKYSNNLCRKHQQKHPTFSLTNQNPIAMHLSKNQKSYHSLIIIFQIYLLTFSYFYCFYNYRMEKFEELKSPLYTAKGSGVDSLQNKNKKNQSFGSTRNTFNIRTGSQFHRTSRHPRIPAWKDIANWRESATSLTRDQSPQYRFPQQKRFTSIQEDRAKSCGDRNKLNLRKEFQGGQSFGNSKRPTYFPPEFSLLSPAPGAHELKRWLQETDNLAQPSSLILEGSVRQKEPQRSRKSYSSIVRGRTIGKQVRDNSKYYLDHSRNHVGHHENIVIGHPGVGRYTISLSSGKQKPAYSMGQVLIDPKQNFPAPNVYTTNVPYIKPSTNKQTFDKGSRLDLARPLNENPGPNEYSIRRFLQSKRK